MKREKDMKKKKMKEWRKRWSEQMHKENRITCVISLERENRQANLTHERETRQQHFMREQFAMMAQLHGQMIHAINGFFQGASTHSGPHVAPQMQAAIKAKQTKAKETMTPLLSQAVLFQTFSM